METLLLLTIILGSIRSICWLIDRKEQRKFCETATPKRVEAYIRMLGTSEKQELAPVKKLERVIESKVKKLKAA